MEIQRWLKTDPVEDRCDSIISNGKQCGNRIVPGATRCPMHGANKQLQKAEAASLRLYRLAKFQVRADELTDHSKVKSLREEIAILRILLESKINNCDDTHDLLLQSGPISDLVMKIEKIVASCHRLESSLGGLLDKTRIKQIANEMMNSVAERVSEALDDPEIVSQILELVASDVIKTLERKE